MSQKKKKSVASEAGSVIWLPAAGYEQTPDAARAKKRILCRAFGGNTADTSIQGQGTDFVYPASRNIKGNFSIDIVFKFVINCYRSHRK